MSRRGGGGDRVGRQPEDDIYGASDEEPEQQNEHGRGNSRVGTSNGDRGDDSGDGEQGQEPYSLPENQGFDWITHVQHASRLTRKHPLIITMH